MRIKKTRINKVENYLHLLSEGESFYITLTTVDEQHNRLKRIGFSKEMVVGEQILPKPLGRISSFNSEGGFKRRRDLPKEKVYYQREWKRQQWAGRGKTEEVTGIVDIPYKRHHREQIAPPSEQLCIVQDSTKQKIVVSKLLINKAQNKKEIKHIINLFLELFGECEIRKSNLLPPINSKIKNLNWKIFPKGKYPWKKVAPIISKNIIRIKEGKKALIKHRIETISKFEPDFLAIGQGGFHGYWVFGFPSKKLFILESTRKNNATYVFGNDWEELSKLTKADILNNEHQQTRIIHRKGWENNIYGLLN